MRMFPLGTVIGLIGVQAVLDALDLGEHPVKGDGSLAGF
jgi:hypothetical protein